MNLLEGAAGRNLGEEAIHELGQSRADCPAAGKNSSGENNFSPRDQSATIAGEGEVQSAQLSWSSNCLTGVELRSLDIERIFGQTNPPSLARVGFFTNMASVEAAGAVSRESMNSLNPVVALYDNIKHPPPIPLEIGDTTPRHRLAATAASMAFPPSESILAPILEHKALSVATAPD